MLCEGCKKAVAKVHVTEIANGKRRESHFCEQCAQEKHVTSPGAGALPAMVGTVLGKIAESLQAALPGIVVPPEMAAAGGKEIACAECGITFTEFRSGGRLGCAADYVAFKALLDPLVERVQQATEHVGKVPSKSGEGIQQQRELRRLKKDLEEAVRVEDYEKAAVLRDQIFDLERKKA
ncbi:MAG: UvrB/UvrC motif-containing protein [Planctomycetes bacterium]|nr:UvrB/UvrC motif-containing protein [Planctomycetota bacterium]